ncbi:hypothetical protein ACKWTF_015511 [Chironomus riparius]
MFKVLAITIFLIACSYIQVSQSGSDTYIDPSTESPLSSETIEFPSIMSSNSPLGIASSSAAPSSEPQSSEIQPSSPSTTIKTTTTRRTTTTTRRPMKCKKCSDVFRFREKPSDCNCKKDKNSRRRKQVHHKDRNLRGCCEDDDDDDEHDRDDRDRNEIARDSLVRGWAIEWHEDHDD